MRPLEEAILRTVLYADVFSFPMKADEIHHYLIADEPFSLAEIEQTLLTSTSLKRHLERHDQYIFYKGRHHLIEIRVAHEKASEVLWKQAITWGKLLARLPFVQMVGLTGALAVRNAADGDDDLDFLLVTRANRVWIARAFAILLVRMARLVGITLCPNYVLAETSLYQNRQDIFTAHEVAQMIPLHGQDIYRRFREENDWVYDYLPNALDPFFDEVEQKLGLGAKIAKGFLEFGLGGRLGNMMERWEYRRKLQRFSKDLQTPFSSARLDHTQVKGHFNDHGHPVLRDYHARLRNCGLESQPMALTGD
ncbi:MAG: hypothetical protein R3E39_02515 [Anaerolineae bacterium]